MPPITPHRSLPPAATATAPAATAVAATVAVATTALTVGRVAREGQRELARVVDVVDPHGHLVAEVEHVLHTVDALAAPDLGDVEQAVTAREDVDERPELGDVHHPTGVLRSEVGGRW